MNTSQPKCRPIPGAVPLGNGRFHFAVWAPQRKKVELCVRNSPYVEMAPDSLGYYCVERDLADPETRYMYRLDGDAQFPDPASRWQPDGVHAASGLFDPHSFQWTDQQWKPPALEDTVFYELHIGTFTKEGTFKAVIPQLSRLADLGITTIEIMPIAQFPGARNWGYDGTYPFAAQNSYGGPADLQELVNAAHERNLAVALDVVYNHLGPEGNYLREFAPYFTDHYRTPWGSALNFDGAQSDEVRHFFIQSALYWLENFHIDALRLDAIHGIFDSSALPFLAEMSQAVASLSQRLNKTIHLIAESDLNDVRVVRSVDQGGLGMDSQWSDDFHHSVHTLLTKETAGYYRDFGDLHSLSDTLACGWKFSGQYSKFRQRKHGNAPDKLKPAQFVVCNQNHDQVGNRNLGERLSRLVNFEQLKLAAGVTILSPYVPLLFMGEEYGEAAPFLYFTSHGDPELAEAVRHGRKSEFASFGWQGDIPDPQAESTFEASKLNHSVANEDPHKTLQQFYRMLLQFRRKHRFGHLPKPSVTEYADSRVVLALYEGKSDRFAMIFNFNSEPVPLNLELTAGPWNNPIYSASSRWLGPDSSERSKTDLTGCSSLLLRPQSFLVLQHSNTRASAE